MDKKLLEIRERLCGIIKAEQPKTDCGESFEAVEAFATIALAEKVLGWINDGETKKSDTIAYKMFGKRYRDLTEVELREYLRVRKRETRRLYALGIKRQPEQTIAFQMFGRQRKDLTAEEMLEYRRSRQAAHRLRKANKNTDKKMED